MRHDGCRDTPLISPTYVTRFAPSPTGPLHLGHAFSALTAWDRAQRNDGHFLLRIEDIDQSRARPEWEAAIYDDLTWLGLDWPRPVMRQSDRLGAYRDALQQLWDLGLLYPCTCTRRDIAEATSAPQEGAPLLGPDGIVYPGTCRGKPRTGKMPIGSALRLDMEVALQLVDRNHVFNELGIPFGVNSFQLHAADISRTIGDVVLARRDMGTSYHLSVVLDDAAQDVTEVVRGADLFDATWIHMILQALLGLPTPTYYHHALIRGPDGKRLAKRDDAQALSLYRQRGLSAADLCALVGL